MDCMRSYVNIAFFFGFLKFIYAIIVNKTPAAGGIPHI